MGRSFLFQFAAKPGAGKTFTAIDAANKVTLKYNADNGTSKRVLLIAPENGASHYSDHPECCTDVTDFIPVDDISQVVELLFEMKARRDQPYLMVILDTDTVLWDAIQLRYLQKVRGRSGGFVDEKSMPTGFWGKCKRPFKQFLDLAASIGVGVIVCSQAGMKIDPNGHKKYWGISSPKTIKENVEVSISLDFDEETGTHRWMVGKSRIPAIRARGWENGRPPLAELMCDALGMFSFQANDSLTVEIQEAQEAGYELADVTALFKKLAVQNHPGMFDGLTEGDTKSVLRGMWLKSAYSDMVKTETGIARAYVHIKKALDS